MTIRTKAPVAPTPDLVIHQTLLNRFDRFKELAEGRALFHADTLRNLYNERDELRTRMAEAQHRLDMVEVEIVEQAGLNAAANKIVQAVDGYVVTLNRRQNRAPRDRMNGQTA